MEGTVNKDNYKSLYTHAFEYISSPGRFLREHKVFNFSRSQLTGKTSTCENLFCCLPGTFNIWCHNLNCNSHLCICERRIKDVDQIRKMCINFEFFNIILTRSFNQNIKQFSNRATILKCWVLLSHYMKHRTSESVLKLEDNMRLS